MNEIAKQIIILINNNISLKELSQKLHLSYKELYKYLMIIKNNGFEVLKKYYYDGNITYSFLKQIDDYHNQNTIITSPDENELEFIVISDLHLGSLYEKPFLLHVIYDYCIKNNIHYLLNLGDLVEGVVNKNNIHLSWDKQMDHVLRLYPMSDEIISFLLLGNHDYSLFTNYGFNVAKCIQNKRDDINVLGYGEGIINLKNDQIILQHPLLTKDFRKGIYNKCIILRGHGHEAKIVTDNSSLVIYIPSLSLLNFNRSTLPGAVYLKLKMRCGRVENVEIEELTLINKRIHITSSINVYVGNHKNYKNDDIIENEENYKILKKELL